MSHHESIIKGPIDGEFATLMTPCGTSQNTYDPWTLIVGIESKRPLQLSPGFSLFFYKYVYLLS